MQTVNANSGDIQREQFLRLQQVEAMTGCGKSTIYLLMKRGSFPRSVAITPRLVAWPESAVQRWAKERVAAASAATGHP